MANKYTGSEVAKKNRPNAKAKVTERRTARKESGMSSQKFYVKTRMAEAAKGGKTVNAKDLRKKFQSGEVTRKGFGAPKKKTGGTGSSSTGSSSKGSSSTGSSSKGSSSTGSSSKGSSSKAFPDLKNDVAALKVKDSRRRPATQNMRGTSGFTPGKVQGSSKNKPVVPPSPADLFREKYRNVPGATKNKLTPYKP